MATWNINVEAVEGPATSTTGNIPQWADTSGDVLNDGLGVSDGSDDTNKGKLVKYDANGVLRAFASTGSSHGAYLSGDSGVTRMIVMCSGAAVGVRIFAADTYGISVEQIGSTTTLARFAGSRGQLYINQDGSLSWTSAAGSAGTTANLDAMVGDSGSGGTKGLVPAPAAGDAAAGKFLKADGTWEAVPGSSGGDAWGDAVDADIVPDADGTRDLGSSANRFAELHIDQIDLNGTTINSLEDGADVTDATNVAAAGALMTADAGALATLDTVRTSEIDADAVTNNELANMSASTIKGRRTASGGDPEDLDADAVSDILETATDPFVRTSALSGAVDQIDFESVEPGDDTITLRLYAHYAFTINELRIKTASGTCTVAVKIDGTDVTGVSAVAVSSTEATGTATAANSVSVGQTVTLVISSSSSVANLVGSLKFTR